MACHLCPTFGEFKMSSSHPIARWIVGRVEAGKFIYGHAGQPKLPNSCLAVEKSIWGEAKEMLVALQGYKMTLSFAFDSFTVFFVQQLENAGATWRTRGDVAANTTRPRRKALISSVARGK